jgi:hypothetical protein
MGDRKVARHNYRKGVMDKAEDIGDKCEDKSDRKENER